MLIVWYMIHSCYYKCLLTTGYNILPVDLLNIQYVVQTQREMYKIYHVVYITYYIIYTSLTNIIELTYIDLEMVL